MRGSITRESTTPNGTVAMGGEAGIRGIVDWGRGGTATPARAARRWAPAGAAANMEITLAASVAERTKRSDVLISLPSPILNRQSAIATDVACT
jgi:hypothetical protein